MKTKASGGITFEKLGSFAVVEGNKALSLSFIKKFKFKKGATRKTVMNYLHDKMIKKENYNKFVGVFKGVVKKLYKHSATFFSFLLRFPLHPILRRLQPCGEELQSLGARSLPLGRAIQSKAGPRQLLRVRTLQSREEDRH